MNKRDVRNFGLSLLFLLALVGIVLVPSLLHAMATSANKSQVPGPQSAPVSPTTALLNTYNTPASLPPPSDPNAFSPEPWSAFSEP